MQQSHYHLVNFILGKTSPHLASILISTSLSALVGPIFKIAIGFPWSLAAAANLYPEYTWKINRTMRSMINYFQFSLKTGLISFKGDNFNEMTSPTSIHMIKGTL